MHPFCRQILAPLALTVTLLLGLLSCEGSTPRLPAMGGEPLVDESVPQNIKQAAELYRLALEEGRSYEMLESLCREAPGRLSGSPAAARAVEWAARTMREIGLVNVRKQPCMVPVWERGEVERLELVEGEQRTALPILALGGSVPTAEGGVEGELIVVRSFEELQELGRENCEGKIVLFNRPMPRALRSTFMAYGQAVNQRVSGAAEAAKVGAKAVIVRSMTTLVDDVPHTGVMRYQDGVAKIPAAAIATRPAAQLAARVKRGERILLRLELNCRNLPDRPSHNVIGEIVGAEHPEEIVLVGGHLDGWDICEGAHDDGAGMVHALEACRLILQAGLRPQRTIRCVLFMNEENGLRGAHAYMAENGEDQHVAAIESDRGGYTPLGFTTSLRGTDLTWAKRLVEPMRAYDMGAMIPGGGGADITPLMDQGVAVFGLATISHRYFDMHHSVRDKLEAVNPRELALGCAAVAFLTWSLTKEPPRCKT
jgi:carboxypeptidase Q